MNSPLLLYFVNTELFARADVSVMAHHGFHGGIALAMLIFSIREGTTKFDPARKIVETRFRDVDRGGRARRRLGHDGHHRARRRQRHGARCAPSASRTSTATGSSPGRRSSSPRATASTTSSSRAPRRPAGSEDDPLAGLGGPVDVPGPGLRGRPHGRRARASSPSIASRRSSATTARCTAALTFDRAPAALVGKRGEGFKYMLTLMNNARLGVGFESLGLCEAALPHGARLRGAAAVDGQDHRSPRDDRRHARRDAAPTSRACARSRCTARSTRSSRTKYELFASRIARGRPATITRPSSSSASAKQHKRNARRVTPLLKYLAAEKAVEMARRNMQIHGGNGYMKEYGAEKLLRDALVMPIYEGTSQIQSLMAMKDALGGMMKAPQGFVKQLAQARWRACRPATRSSAAWPSCSTWCSAPSSSWCARPRPTRCSSLSRQAAVAVAQALREDWNPKRDFAYAMLHAERLTRMLTDAAIAEVLLEQARKHPERARRARALPRARRAALPPPARRDPDHRCRAARALQQDERSRPTQAARSEQSWPCPNKHVLQQGPVLATLGRAAVDRVAPAARRAARSPRAHRHAADPVAGDPRDHRRRDPPIWSATTSATSAAIRRRTAGIVPPHLFPQWGFPLQRAHARGPALPAGCACSTAAAACEMNAPLPSDEPLEVARAARGHRRRRPARRAPRSAWSPARSRRPTRWSRDLFAIVPLGTGKRQRQAQRRHGSGRRRKKDTRARARRRAELARWRLGADAGLDFAKLTGDFNPVHWVPRLRARVRLPQRILHGFATMARAFEGLHAHLFAGDRARAAVRRRAASREPLVAAGRGRPLRRRRSSSSSATRRAARRISPARFTEARPHPS